MININRLMSSSIILILLFGVVFAYGFFSGKRLGDIALEDFINRGKELALENSIKFRDLEEKHKREENKLLHNLMEQKEQYEISITQLSDDFNNRMLKQTNRTNYYRRLSESGHPKQSDLAEHTSKLDTSLEEGIHLVNELSETIRLLERNIETRDKIIANDRKIINERK